MNNYMNKLKLIRRMQKIGIKEFSKSDTKKMRGIRDDPCIVRGISTSICNEDCNTFKKGYSLNPSGYIVFCKRRYGEKNPII